MVKVNLGGCSTFVTETEYKANVDKALAALEVLENETGKGNDFLGWKHLPSETLNSTLVADCEAVRDAWKAKNIDLVVVIGIGGSYLGAKCALEALSHQFAKQLKTKGESPEIVFAGQNLSEEYMCELMDLVQERNAACVVISKSGTTTEPAVAFRLIKKYLEDTYGKAEAAERIVAVTDKARGALKGLATQEGYRTFVIEDNVGGRFSVLTPVGILPIVLAGFDMNSMLKGALEMEELCAKPCECNPAVQYAAMRNALYAQGKKIEILVAYNPKVTFLGEWWKQLFGDSEGKDGLGIFPASVNFTTDLHSMGQYIRMVSARLWRQLFLLRRAAVQCLSRMIRRTLTVLTSLQESMSRSATQWRSLELSLLISMVACHSFHFQSSVSMSTTSVPSSISLRRLVVSAVTFLA